MSYSKTPKNPVQDRDIAFASVRWVGASTTAKIGLQFLQVIVLARLLVPEDFGLMAIVFSIITILNLFSDLGFGKAIIHHEKITLNQLSSLYWLNFAAAFIIMVSLICAAPLIGRIYGEPRLISILIVSGTIFPLVAIGYQFRMLAEKELNFSVLARLEIISSVIGFAIAIAVAMAGGDVWAIVTGALSAAACSSIMSCLWLSNKWRPKLHLSIKECRSLLYFGGYTMGERLANNIRMQSDIFVAGLLFPPAAIGLYSLPRDLCLRIALLINPIVTRVGFPLMAKSQNDVKRLRYVYLQTLRMIASVNFPIYLVLLIFAEGIVAILFGRQWQGATVYLQILSIFGLIRCIGNPVGSLIYAAGRAKVAFWWNVTLMAVIPVVFYAGSSLGGLKGLSWSLLISQSCILFLSWRFLVYPLCGAGFIEFIAQLISPLVIALTAFGCAYLLTMSIDSPIITIITGLTVGLCIYIGLSLQFNRQWAKAMMELAMVGKVGKKK